MEEMHGWEIEKLSRALSEEKAGENKVLSEYCKSNPLASINDKKDKFFIIRKFASRIYEGKVDALNKRGLEGEKHYPIPHNGITLVQIYENGDSSETKIILPNALTFKKANLMDDIITMYTAEGLKLTNFEEIETLLPCYQKFTEEEILDKYNSFQNKRNKTAYVQVELVDLPEISDSYFGKLKYNEELEMFDVTKKVNGTEVYFLFSNTSKEQLEKNIRGTEELMNNLQPIEKAMIADRLKLKNETWLEEDEDEWTAENFQKEICLHAINIYDEGNFELYYAAKDLFWGHEIQVHLDKENNFESANLVG